MAHEQFIIDALNGLVWLLVALVLGMTLRLALTRPQATLIDDPDFEEFYLDLCASTLVADFTREEAEGLYRVWQGQSKSTSRIVETRKGDNT